MEQLKQDLATFSKEQVIDLFANYAEMVKGRKENGGGDPKPCNPTSTCGVCVDGVWVKCS